MLDHPVAVDAEHDVGGVLRGLEHHAASFAHGHRPMGECALDEADVVQWHFIGVDGAAGERGGLFCRHVFVQRPGDAHQVVVVEEDLHVGV